MRETWQVCAQASSRTREVVQQQIEVTDDGKLLLRQYKLKERYFYRRVVNVMHTTTLNEPEEEKITRKEFACVDLCCKACICSIRSINPLDYMSPGLRRGRAKGWLMHSEIIFPFISDTVLELLVSFLLITVMLAFALSAPTFSMGKKQCIQHCPPRFNYFWNRSCCR